MNIPVVPDYYSSSFDDGDKYKMTSSFDSKKLLVFTKDGSDVIGEFKKIEDL